MVEHIDRRDEGLYYGPTLTRSHTPTVLVTRPSVTPTHPLPMSIRSLIVTRPLPVSHSPHPPTHVVSTSISSLTLTHLISTALSLYSPYLTFPLSTSLSPLSPSLTLTHPLSTSLSPLRMDIFATPSIVVMPAACHDLLLPPVTGPLVVAAAPAAAPAPA